MSNPTIITAFVDIGRSKWEGFLYGHPLPSYLKRTTDEYFTNFERLLKLDNDMVVFTTEDLVPRFKSYQEKKPNLCVIGFDWKNCYLELKEAINKIQLNPKFNRMIKQPFLPEYWNPDYVLINFLKSVFVNQAIGSGIVATDLVGWIDFGYCRDDNTVPTNTWSYDFDLNKIHFFSVKKFVPAHMDIKEVIINNHVFIQGCHIVASKEKWQYLESEMNVSVNTLIEHGWIDDDQTMLYMCYCRNPQKYAIHYLNENKGWFQVFQEFNHAVS